MGDRSSIGSYLPLSESEDSEMAPLNPLTTATVDDLDHFQRDLADSPVQYKVYRERFLGLAVLVLLNIIVSWDVRDKLRIAHLLCANT